MQITLDQLRESREACTKLEIALESAEKHAAAWKALAKKKRNLCLGHESTPLYAALRIELESSLESLRRRQARINELELDVQTNAAAAKHSHSVALEVDSQLAVMTQQNEELESHRELLEEKVLQARCFAERCHAQSVHATELVTMYQGMVVLP